MTIAPLKPIAIGWAILMVAAWQGIAVAAGDGQPSLDQLLGTVAPDTVPASQPAVPSEGSQSTPSRSVELETDVLRRLTDQTPSDMFGQAVVQMDEVAGRLGDKLDAGQETQRLQTSILAKLDQLIAAAQKQGLSAGSGGGEGAAGQAQQQEFGSGHNTGSQREQAGDRPSSGADGTDIGTGDQPTPGQDQSTVMQDHRSHWGNLPDRLRNELWEGLNERFSSVYKDLTGQYYRRLAQEKP